MALTFPPVSSYRWSCKDESKRFTVDNPATGKSITTIQAGDASTADSAVKASEIAFHKWRWIPARDRSTYLLRCADILKENGDELATILCMENGKPKVDARKFDINALVILFRYFGSICDKLPSEFYDRGSTYCTVFHEPHGVCCAILPFNWPPNHTGGKLAPALAAGNTVILKPGEQAPLTCFRIVELLCTVLPEDVVQIIPGIGPEVPQALIQHPLVKMVSFTGSTGAGSAVAKTAADSITPVVLELGGKNAMVVFEDADFDLAVRDALEGAFFNKGEACTGLSRLLVHETMYSKFVEKLSEGVKKLVAGNGLDSRTHVGPQVSREQCKKILDYIELAKQEGATIAAQAPLPSDPACRDGFFAPITLVSGVKEHMRIAKEEMFGTIGQLQELLSLTLPDVKHRVATVMPFTTFEDAIRIVNSTEYGLTAAVYTNNLIVQNRAVRQIEAGMVWINNYSRSLIGTPFGGVKHSGYGREHSIDTLKEWCVKKAVHTPSGFGDIPKWRVVEDIFGESGSDAV